MDRSEYQVHKLAFNEANRSYFEDSVSIVSDTEFDALAERLIEVEKRNPDWVIGKPVSEALGYSPSGQNKRPHYVTPMLSLNKSYNVASLRKYLEATAMTLGSVEWVVEPKWDGVAVTIVYENGNFVYAATRGNGLVGEDVSGIVKAAQDVPLQIVADGRVEVRGEVVVAKIDFHAWNRKHPEKTFKTSRHMASGILRQKNPDAELTDALRFIAYSVDRFETQSKGLVWLSENGFESPPYWSLKTDIDEVIEAFNETSKHRDAVPVDIDGIVVKVNSVSAQQYLGETQHHPRWVIAQKFGPLELTTTLRAIELKVSRLGTIKPVAIVDQVQFGEVVIERVNLHNVRNIVVHDLRVGDKVKVLYLADAIPAIGKPDRPSTRPKDGCWEPPTHCPCCNNPLKYTESGADLYCDNLLRCKGAIVAQITHFVSKEAMNIRGISEWTIMTLVEQDVISNVSDLYALTEREFSFLGAKNAVKVIGNIENSRYNPLWMWLSGLSIEKVTPSISRDLAHHYDSLQRLSEASVAELTQILEGKESVAMSMVIYFAAIKDTHLVQRLDNLRL